MSIQAEMSMNFMRGRQTQIRTIFSRLTGGQSAAIVGEPRTGKTMLLRQVAKHETQEEWLPEVSRFSLLMIDANKFPPNLTFAKFWEWIFIGLIKQSPASFQKELQSFIDKGRYTKTDLEHFFELIDNQSLRIALLIDHFDDFISHPSLGNNETLAFFRSMVCKPGIGGLALIIATRDRISRLNRRALQGQTQGSPLFNHLQEIRLTVFDSDESRQLLSEDCDNETIKYLLSITGQHPYLIMQGLHEYKRQRNLIELSKILTPVADEHFDEAFKYLYELGDVLFESLGYLKLPYQVAGHIEDLIWRGWLKRTSDNDLVPTSLLLKNWLDKRVSDITKGL